MLGSLMGDAKRAGLLRRTCLQCGKPSKYCCPKCSARSCSLPCVKQHKKIGECDGIRDKTAYIPLDGFTDLDLLSDYRFLEESARIVDSVCRTKPALGVYPQQKSLPGFLHKFQAECRRRGTVLKLLPRCFTKRQENKSQYNFRERCIYWHVAWIFPAAHVKVHESQSYYNLDLSVSLEHCLKGKVVVEYPTFTVVLTEDLSQFNLISPEPSGIHGGTNLPAFFNTDGLSGCENE
ncbi:box C/D snoRNA protein 1 isoform X3 [Dermacentor albipictus]|uniref:box C/D snoRNA protein 1 isoform X3 n=1 Tax=Dermacentor albipictus TaxID=60249 RepID=UPI0038FC0D97